MLLKGAPGAPFSCSASFALGANDRANGPVFRLLAHIQLNASAGLRLVRVR
jgi:hypothetical protein